MERKVFEFSAAIQKQNKNMRRKREFFAFEIKTLALELLCVRCLYKIHLSWRISWDTTGK
jgi:hypothetical protein